MKKTCNRVIVAVIVLSNGYAYADNNAKLLVAIDSMAIMQKSLEGKGMVEKIQKEIDAFQQEVQSTQKELSEQQESLAKQAKVLSKEAMQEKVEGLNQKKKKLEREFAGKEEELRNSIQKRQLALRERQLVVVNQVFEKEGWGALIDKNTPGLLCVANTIDRTEQLLKEVDAKYQQAKSSKDSTVKVAAKDSVKPSIKVA